jgi:hypothetical protein
MVSVAGLEVYRVNKRFGWEGWEYAPEGACRCACGIEGAVPCVGHVGESCPCAATMCRCSCGIASNRYAGGIWMVAPGHPRKVSILDSHFAGGDGSLPRLEELLAQDHYKRLLTPWKPEEHPVTEARRGPGRPRGAG